MRIKINADVMLVVVSAVQVTPVTAYKHFRMVSPMKPPFTPNLDIGNHYVTFG
jgi:hypothetical protein